MSICVTVLIVYRYRLLPGISHGGLWYTARDGDKELRNVR